MQKQLCGELRPGGMYHIQLQMQESQTDVTCRGLTIGGKYFEFKKEQSGNCTSPLSS